MSQELPFQEWTGVPQPDAREQMRNGMQELNKKNSESCKLLDLSSGSDSDPEPLQLIPPKRKVRFKKRLRAKAMIPSVSTASGCGCSCIPIAKGIALLMLAVVLVVQIWFVLNVWTRVDNLYAFYKSSVDAENKQLPGTLHSIHSQLKQIEQNLTSLAADLRETSSNVTSLAKEVSELKQTTTDLQESVAAAHKIMKLPTHFEDITKNAARIGSDVASLQSQMKTLKQQQDAMQGLEARVADMQAVLNNTADTNETLFQRYGALESCVTELNSSLASIAVDVRHQNEELEQLKDTCTSNCTQLQGEHPSFSPYQKSAELLTQVMGGANTTQALKEAQHLVYLYRGVAERLNVSISGSFGGDRDEVRILLGALAQVPGTGAVHAISREPEEHEEVTSPSTAETTTTTTTTPQPRRGFPSSRPAQNKTETRPGT